MCSACCEDGRLMAGVRLDGCASDVQHRAWPGVATPIEGKKLLTPSVCFVGSNPCAGLQDERADVVSSHAQTAF